MAMRQSKCLPFQYSVEKILPACHSTKCVHLTKSLNSTRNKGTIDKEIGLVVGRIDRAKERGGSWWDRRQCSPKYLNLTGKHTMPRVPSFAMTCRT